MSKKRLLPAHVFDFLYMSSLATDGMGAHLYGDYEDYGDGTALLIAPRCLIGHFKQFNRVSGRHWNIPVEASAEIENAIQEAFGDIHPANEVDAAITAINNRNGDHSSTRVDFLDLAAELGLDIRTEAPNA